MRNIRIKYSIDYDQLRKALKALELTDKEVDEVARSLDKMGDEANKAGKKVEKSTKGAGKEMNGLGNIAGKIGGALVAAFAVDRIIAFGRKVIDITAEFQKLNAVLANSLGSEGLGERAFKRIQEFAATTNFSVLEATQAFVKLTNQGFEPTNAELTKLADLANSTGKSFDQLAEAIIDAQVGEFERLKEFGIRAKQQGDQVTFTFKGVETQVKKTDENIRDYILSLGELEGVSGSTEKISQTLGGRISNLGDATDQLFSVIGGGVNGPLQRFIGALTEVIVKVTDLTKAVFGLEDQLTVTDEELVRLTDDFSQLSSSAQQKELENLTKVIGETRKEITRLSDEIEKTETAIDDRDLFSSFEKSFGKSLFQAKEDLISYKQEINPLKASLKDLEALQQLYLKANKETTESEKEAADKAREAREAAEEYWMGQLKALQDYANSLEKLRATGGLFPDPRETPELDQAIQDFNDNAIDSLKNRLDKEQKLKDEALEGDLERMKEREEAERELENVLLDLAVETFDTLFGFDERRLQQLEASRNRELQLAGENEEAKLAIEKNFAEQERRLLAEKARRDKQQALFNLAINQGPAIAKTASTLGFPLAIPFIAAVGALFIQQISKINSAQLPTFHTGKKAGDLNANEKLAVVRKDEAILSPESTKMYNKNGLVDMMVDRKLDPKLLDNIGKNSPFAYPVLSDERIVKAIENQKIHQTLIKNGEFLHAIKKGNSRTVYYNSRYSL